MLGLLEPWCEQAEKIWHNRRRSGVCLALLLVAFAYYSPRFFYNLSTLYLCLVSSSFDNIHAVIVRATRSAHVMIVLIIAISNALIYGFAFFRDWTGLGVVFTIELCEFQNSPLPNLGSASQRPTAFLGRPPS